MANVFGSHPTDVNTEALLALYQQGEYGDVLKAFLRVFHHFEETRYEDVDGPLQDRIDRFVETFLYIMAKPDFRILEKLAPLAVCYNHIIANLVAMSSFHTTDPQVRMLMRQKGNFVKLLMLYSPQNSIRLDAEHFFATQPVLTSLWYMMTPIARGGGATRTVYENLKHHVASMSDRFIVPDERVAPLYFLSTYFDPDRDRDVKRRLNTQIQQRVDRIRIRNRPNPDSIAIVTAKWFPASAVYRSSHPFIERLARRRQLTLVHLGVPTRDLDKSLFARVCQVVVRDGTAKVDDVLSNDFAMVYFTDVGMNPESVWLSNMRLAPIQAAGYGHPVSTFGSRVDYFIGGADVELVENAQKNYSERLVLIPGLGAHPVYPNYTPRRPSHPDNQIVINCPWGYAKLNYPMVQNLQAIQRRARRTLRFQFLPAWSLANYNATVPFRRELCEAFGQTVTLVANQTYDVYMQWMEKGHLSIDSYPFGGYNTIVDSLHLGRPIVTYEGTRFANRAASALLRRLGLDELIAHNDEEYIEKTVRLVDDDAYRDDLTRRLAAMDLRAMLFDTAEPEAFERAVDFLIEHHESLAQDGTRSPIFIQ